MENSNSLPLESTIQPLPREASEDAWMAMMEKMLLLLKNKNARIAELEKRLRQAEQALQQKTTQMTTIASQKETQI